MVEFNPFDRTFAALADPTRRAILQQLVTGPARVTEIAKPFSISLNAVSRHLQVLERAGLVEREIRGREHWIHFGRAPLKAARDWTVSMLSFWDSRMASQSNATDSDADDGLS